MYMNRKGTTCSSIQTAVSSFGLAQDRLSLLLLRRLPLRLTMQDVAAG